MDAVAGTISNTEAISSRTPDPIRPQGSTPAMLRNRPTVLKM